MQQQLEGVVNADNSQKVQRMPSDTVNYNEDAFALKGSVGESSAGLLTNDAGGFERSKHSSNYC